ncbi:MAG: glycosyltransferase family 4 protein [Anaerolineae bacterium]
MSIYVDVSCAVHAKAGLKRYAENLVRGLRPLLGDRLRLFQNSLGSRGPLEGWQGWPTAGVRWSYRPWRAAVLAGQVAGLDLGVGRLLPDAELFHATEHLLPHLSGIPTVLTVHDLIFERFPQHHKFFNYRYLRAAMPLYCRRASAIVAVSEATKRDLLALYGIDPVKVTVIPEAAAERFRPTDAQRIEKVRRRHGLPPRYVLRVGTIEPRKNLDRLVDACGPLFQDGLADALVIVGSKGWLYEGFFEHLEASPWRDRVILPGFIPDEDLPAVYAGALLTVEPSVYEGFGLSVLEGMASGSPVCCSDVSSLPEVGGDAARYFAPEDTDAISACLRAVIADEALRQTMRAQGLARAASFSWSSTAEQTLALYRRVMGKE